MQTYSSLNQFDEYRSESGITMIEKSNSFYDVSGGSIGIYCEDANIPSLVLSTESGSIQSGNARIVKPPYSKFVVKQSTELIIDENTTISTDMDVHGTVVLKSGVRLVLDHASLLTFYPDSTLVIESGCEIHIANDSLITIYGKVDVSLAALASTLHQVNVVIDTIAVLNVNEIDLGTREYSLTDFDKSLRDMSIISNTQGEHNSGMAKLGYTWKGGDVTSGSQVIDINVMWGNAILGDFKFQCLGSQETTIDNLQIVRNLKVNEGSTLNVASMFAGFQYIEPELYLGVVIENIATPADCEVRGKLICSGNGIVTVDRKATLHISESGSVYLEDDAILRCTHIEEDDQVLFVDGTLSIDRIEQLAIPSPTNIVFGEKGKLVIRNKYPDETVLFSTPNGVRESELYRLFGDNLSHVEYHVPENCGIAIDEYFQFYSRDMTEWYAGMRFEKAVKDGLLVWENGFIRLDHTIIPWVTTASSLYDVANLFKNSSSDKKSRLQEVVDHMVYCGTGDIVFQLVDGENTASLTMRTAAPSIRTAANVPGTDVYRLTTTTSGFLFARNDVPSSSKETIVSPDGIIGAIGTETEVVLK